MSKRPKVADKPLTEVMALRTDAEFKDETVRCANLTNSDSLSEYLKTAVEEKNRNVCQQASANGISR